MNFEHFIPLQNVSFGEKNNNIIISDEDSNHLIPGEEYVTLEPMSFAFLNYI